MQDGLIGQSSQLQVGQPAVVVYNEDDRITALKFNKGSFGVVGVTEKLEAVAKQVFHSREWRQPVSALGGSSVQPGSSERSKMDAG